MTDGMRVGLTLPMADSDSPDGRAPRFETTLEYARAAEAGGLDSIWIFDHLLFRVGEQPPAGVREGWTTLTALAPLVSRVELVLDGFAELGFDDAIVWSIPKSRELLDRVAEARELHRRRFLPRSPAPDTIGLP